MRSKPVPAVWIEVEDTVEGAFATARTDAEVLYRTVDYGWSGGDAAREDAKRWAAERGHTVEADGIMRADR